MLIGFNSSLLPGCDISNEADAEPLVVTDCDGAGLAVVEGSDFAAGAADVGVVELVGAVEVVGAVDAGRLT